MKESATNGDTAQPRLKIDWEFTATPNVFYDYWQQRMSMAAWCVLSPIVRKTIGWGGLSDRISYSQLKELSGIKSTNTIKRAIVELVALGLIEVHPAIGRRSAEYSLVWPVECQNLIGCEAVEYQDLTPQKRGKESAGDTTASVTQTTGYPDDSGIYVEHIYGAPSHDQAEMFSARADKNRRNKRKAELNNGLAYVSRHGYDETVEYENE